MSSATWSACALCDPRQSRTLPRRCGKPGRADEPLPHAGSDPTARSMRRIAQTQARGDEMLVVRGVNVLPSQIEERIPRTPAPAANRLDYEAASTLLDGISTRNVEPRPRDDRTVTGIPNTRETRRTMPSPSPKPSRVA